MKSIMATFLERLLRGDFSHPKPEPLNVGKPGGYPEYQENEELTAEKYNVATKKIDEIIDNHDIAFRKLLNAIHELAQTTEETSADGIKTIINNMTDGHTLRVNPDTGKLEVYDISEKQIKSDKVMLIDPETGQITGLNLNNKVSDIEQRLTQLENTPAIVLDDYVMFINKGLVSEIITI